MSMNVDVGLETEGFAITSLNGSNPMNKVLIRDTQAKNSSTHLDKKVNAKPLENGDLIVHYLEKIGVEYVFGIPGGAIEPLYNAMARSEVRGGLRAIVSRHETGAAFMADGYTRESGKLGVCCGTTGPGSTNLITGVASAYENEIPQLVITAQTALSTFGKGALQESSCTSLNTLGMFHHCTRYNSLVSHPAQLETKLIAAIMAALRSPCGPAHLSIPVDILNAPSDMKDYALDVNAMMAAEATFNSANVSQLLEEICNAKNIVIVMGAGCSGVAHAVVDLATLLGARIVTSIDGKGLVSSYHPLFRGVFGFAGHASAMETLRDPKVDLVLAVGTNFCELSTGGWDEESLLNDRLIHIDSVATHFIRSPMARLQVIGCIEEICTYLVKKLYRHKTKNHLKEFPAVPGAELVKDNVIQQSLVPSCILDEAEKYHDDSTPIKPQRLMKELGQLFPPTTHFLADAGNSYVWATHYLHPIDRRLGNRRSPKRADFLDAGRRKKRQPRVDSSSYRAGIEFASMGWAIGTAIGTAMANKDCPVVCITGDGSMLMSGQEITVAHAEGLPIIFVILNDSALGMVKHGQRLANAEKIGFQLPEVDFCLFARSMGINSHTIRSPADLINLDINELIKLNGPTLLDVYIDPEEVPPMGMRVKALAAARKMNERRKNIEQNLARNT